MADNEGPRGRFNTAALPADVFNLVSKIMKAGGIPYQRLDAEPFAYPLLPELARFEGGEFKGSRFRRALANLIVFAVTEGIHLNQGWYDRLHEARTVDAFREKHGGARAGTRNTLAAVYAGIEDAILRREGYAGYPAEMKFFFENEALKNAYKDSIVAKLQKERPNSFDID